MFSFTVSHGDFHMNESIVKSVLRDRIQSSITLDLVQGLLRSEASKPKEHMSGFINKPSLLVCVCARMCVID